MKQNESYKNLCQSFFLALKTAVIHASTNQTFKTTFQLFCRQLMENIADESGIRIEVALNHVFVNGQKIRTDIPFFNTYEYLDQLFKNRNINGITINEKVTEAELEQFISYLARLPTNPPTSHETINQALQEKEITNIQTLPRIEVRTTQQDDKAYQTTQVKRRALKTYVRAMNVMKQSTSTQDGSTQGMRKAKRLVYGMVDICLDEGFSFLGLANVKNYDEYTFNHSINVCVIAIAFGKHLGLSKRQLAELGIAAMFHDYGKTEIPREILNKPGKFEPSEWEIMKSHPLQSVKKLLDMSQFSIQDIKKIIAAFEHHRNYDRTGYPVTGMDKPMNFYSKIVAISDAYDAMTTNRVYQRAMLASTALKILADNSGTKFDPILVKAFINTVGIYPVGSLLKLNGGQLVVVSQQHKDPHKLARPIVQKLKQTSQGFEMDETLIDLSEEANSQLNVEEIVHPEDYGLNVSSLLFADVAKDLAASAKPASQA